jgi:hypothetical protein
LEKATAAKKDSGPHQVQWTGYGIGPDCTLEYRVIFFGKSLEKKGTPVPANTALLPVPTEQESVEVSDGCLSDGRKVWVVYYVRLIDANQPPPQQHSWIPAKHSVDPTVDFSKALMRAALIGGQGDGSLVFWGVSAKYTP